MSDTWHHPNPCSSFYILSRKYLAFRFLSLNIEKKFYTFLNRLVRCTCVATLRSNIKNSVVWSGSPRWVRVANQCRTVVCLGVSAPWSGSRSHFKGVAAPGSSGSRAPPSKSGSSGSGGRCARGRGPIVVGVQEPINPH